MDVAPPTTEMKRICSLARCALAWLRNRTISVRIVALNSTKRKMNPPQVHRDEAPLDVEVALPVAALVALVALAVAANPAAVLPAEMAVALGHPALVAVLPVVVVPHPAPSLSLIHI